VQTHSIKQYSFIAYPGVAVGSHWRDSRSHQFHLIINSNGLSKAELSLSRWLKRPFSCIAYFNWKLKEETRMSYKSNRHQEIVKTLLDSKAVDFEAIGKAVAELGPSLSLANEPWDGFCGTMRTFIRVYIIRGGGGVLEDLGELGAAGTELQS
jgi:hypothetical protein